MTDPKSGNPHAVRVSRLRWSVGGLTIIDDVSLTVPRGEFLSIIGPNGAGKTSLINLISGVYRPDSGTVEVEGIDMTHSRAAARVRSGLARTFQASSLFPGLSVHENVRLAAQASIGGSMDLFRRPRTDDRAGRAADRALERVSLADEAATPAGSLSHGDKRKVELAMVLAGDPDVLLLDEPTAGVAAEETEPLVALIRSVHDEGTTIVMVEHRMEFVVSVSDRIAVLHRGRILSVGTPDEVMADAEVRAAYLGTGA